MSSIRTRAKRVTIVAIASIALVGLSACGSDSNDNKAKKPASTSSATTAAPATAAAEAGQPDWAKPVVKKGDRIASGKVGDITVDVYQLGTTKATKTGQFVDPKTNKPLIGVGDDIVFVNYVVTNNGAPVDLSILLVNISPRYDDWKYMQGMDSIVDSALFEEQGVEADPKAVGSAPDPAIYTFDKGESYSYAENFRYQKNSPITFKLKLTPVDGAAKMLHDKKIEKEITGKIK